MGLIEGQIVGEIRNVVRNLRRRKGNRRQIYVLTDRIQNVSQQAEQEGKWAKSGLYDLELTENPHSIMKAEAVRETAIQVQSQLAEEAQLTSLDSAKVLRTYSNESSLLLEGALRLQAIVSAWFFLLTFTHYEYIEDSNRFDAHKEMENAKKRDERQIHAVVEDRKQGPVPSPLQVQIFDMGYPNVQPRSIGKFSILFLTWVNVVRTLLIGGIGCRYGDIMYYLAVEAQQIGNSGIIYEPEIWIRIEDAHNWGGRRRWVHAKGEAEIDRSRLKLDVVNVARVVELAGTRDYIVIAVNEGGEELPLPLGMYFISVLLKLYDAKWPS